MSFTHSYFDFFVVGRVQEAREMVHRFVNGYQRDIVLFVGHGTTGCVNKLVHLLGLKKPGLLYEATPQVSLPPQR